MTTSSTLAIIGAGLAGARAAAAARGAGFEGRVLLIGDEPGPPYDRPPLSKGVLRGEADPESARLQDDGFYGEHAVELVTDSVVRLDPNARTLVLADSETVRYDAAILATGVEPRRLDVPGADLAGVHHLRTVDDAVRLRDAIRAASRVAVVGAGWIGTEVAASTRQMGADVLLVHPGPAPLHRILGEEIGSIFGELHSGHGVDVRLGTTVAALHGTKTVEEVELRDGRIEAADVVVVGIGATPRVQLAVDAGLRVDDGIVVSQHLHTGAPGVYAAGDVAAAWHPRYGGFVRVDHWANALNQGAAAGRNAVGAHEAYTRLPYFFSDQYDLSLEYVGLSQPGDFVTIRGDLHGRRFVAFWHRDGIVNAAMSVNVWDVLDDLKEIVGAARRVDQIRLADPSVPLADLARTEPVEDPP